MRTIGQGHRFHLICSGRLQAQVQPITRSLLRIDLSIILDFRWDEKIHGNAESFVIVVDGEIILFHDSFILRQRYAEDERSVTLTVPMFELVPPNYSITSPSFQTAGYIARRGSPSHSSTSSFPRSSHLRRRSSTCKCCHCRRYTTKISKKSTRLRSRLSTRSKPRCSRLFTPRMKISSSVPQLEAGKRFTPSSLYSITALE